MTSQFKIDRYYFKSDSVFRDMPDDDLHFLESKMIDRKYRKGQRIFLEGTLPVGVYYLKNGKIKKYKTNKDGKEQIINICNNGELIGYPSLLSEESYTHSTAAMEDSQVAFIPKNDFLNLVAKSIYLSGKLLKTLGHEFGVLVNSVASFAHHSARERLALCLLILREKYKIKSDDKAPVEINLSRQDLANMTGTTVETIVRLLHEFKNEKIIDTKGRKIKILESRQLVKASNL